MASKKIRWKIKENVCLGDEDNNKVVYKIITICIGKITWIREDNFIIYGNKLVNFLSTLL